MENLVAKYCEDLKIFEIYRHLYANGESENNFASNANVLPVWGEAKGQYLYSLLGNRLDIGKDICYNQAPQDLEENMRTMVNNHLEFYDNFRTRLAQVLFGNLDKLYNERNNLYFMSDMERAKEAEKVYPIIFYDAVCGSINNPKNLAAENAIYFPYLYNFKVTSLTQVIGDKKITIEDGKSKAMKVIGKVSAALGLSEEFEKYRIDHSQVLNQKKIKGELHLSIHPMDFATASDNDYNWTSCMSWNDDGCYRMGTVEMMNSRMVLCAYLCSSHHPYHVTKDMNWNSKKWRAWVVITPDIIFVNKNYPYCNDDLSMAAAQWVKELAEQNLGLNYRDVQVNLPYKSAADDHPKFYFTTDYMYNDVGRDDHFTGAFTANEFSCGRNDEGNYEYMNISINYSGEAQCMWCGSTADIECPETLTCYDCSSSQGCHCVRCGSYIDDEDYIFYGPDDEAYCEDCYCDLFTTCDVCGDSVDREETQMVEIVYDAMAVKDIVLNEAKRGNRVARSALGIYNEAFDITTIPVSRMIRAIGNSESRCMCNSCLNHYNGNNLVAAQSVKIPMYDVNNNVTWNPYYLDQTLIDPTKVSIESARMLFGEYTPDRAKVFDAKWESYKNLWDNLEIED